MCDSQDRDEMCDECTADFVDWLWSRDNLTTWPELKGTK